MSICDSTVDVVLIMINATAWINIREYPFLNNKQKYRRDSVLAKHIMTKAEHIIYLSEGWTIEHIGSSRFSASIDAD